MGTVPLESAASISVPTTAAASFAAACLLAAATTVQFSAARCNYALAITLAASPPSASFTARVPTSDSDLGFVRVQKLLVEWSWGRRG